MKVLHVIPSIAQVRGGPSHALIEMVSALRHHGVDAEIATTNDNGPNLLEVPLHQSTIYKGVPVWFFPRFSPSIPAVREFAFSAALTQWLWQCLPQYDVVHIHAIFSYPSTVAMRIARMRKVPYVIRPLGQLCEWSLRQGAQKKKTYLKVVEEANLNSSCGLHLMSAQERQELAHLKLKAPNFVIPHGLEFPDPIHEAREKLRAKYSLPKDEPIVLFLSRLHPKKGINHLVEALGNIREQRFTLILAGNGEPEYENNIREWLNQNGISQRTIMPGFVRGELKQLLLQGADMFALTSHSENFGIAVLEALAAGLPALVTPGVALSSLVSDHGFGRVTKLNREEISRHASELLNDKKGLAEVGRAAKKFVEENYSWKRIAEQLMETYSAGIKSVKIAA